MKTPPITVEVVVHAPIEKVWEYWTKPNHIVNWAFAQDDWHAPKAENDLQVGGKFSTTMAAKDGSFQFDFAGVYTDIKEHELIEYDFGDRHTLVKFETRGSTVKITETFDPEAQNSVEKQQKGWQAILDNFKKYVESNS